jgi:lambda repressor-like predicted transcriptional regulator
MSRFFGDKRIRYRGSSGEILLSHVRERGYSLYRLGQELGYHPRSIRQWNQRGVPRYIVALAAALVHLTPEQLAAWREEVRFLRSAWTPPAP